jgi:hypothetical protein
MAKAILTKIAPNLRKLYWTGFEFHPDREQAKEYPNPMAARDDLADIVQSQEYGIEDVK